MAYDIRLPKIGGATPEVQLAQLNDYLFQLAQNLGFIVNDLDSRTGTAVMPLGFRQQAPSSSASKEDKPKELTFAEIKGLIIKSADIVEAYSEEIQKTLTQQYIAQSEYGQYVENVLADLEASAKLLKQTIAVQQGIVTPTGEVMTVDVNGFIKAGVVDETEDGEYILGVAIGQTSSVDGIESFSKSVQLTTERLAFFDSTDQKNPVAWVSGNMLYINRAEIVDHLTLGDYEVDTNDGVAFKWVGGA